jgi:hypothetical protein
VRLSLGRGSGWNRVIAETGDLNLGPDGMRFPLAQSNAKKTRMGCFGKWWCESHPGIKLRVPLSYVGAGEPKSPRFKLRGGVAAVVAFWQVARANSLNGIAQMRYILRAMIETFGQAKAS